MRHSMLVMLATAALIAAGCGGGDNSGDDTPTSEGSVTRAPVTATAVSPTLPPPTDSPATAPPADPTSAPTQPAPPANTPAAIPTSTTAPPPPPPPPPPPTNTTLNLTAASVRFSPTSLSAPAGNVSIALNNSDAGISHNVHVFAGASASGASLGATAIAAGPVQQTLNLGQLAAGAYFYRCDVHPSQMTGTLTVS